AGGSGIVLSESKDGQGRVDLESRIDLEVHVEPRRRGRISKARRELSALPEGVGKPRSASAVEEHCGGGVRHASRQLLREELACERPWVAELHQLELDALIEQIDEDDGSVR